MQSTYLDSVLTASETVLQAMIAAGADDAAVLSNGSVLMTTAVSNVVATAATQLDGQPHFNFCSWVPAVGPVVLQSQSLHLGNGVFSATYTVPAGTIAVDTFALRQFSTCALQALTLPAGAYSHAPGVPTGLIVDGGDMTYVSSSSMAVPCLRLRGYSRSDPTCRMAYIGAYLTATGVTWNGLDLAPAGPQNNFAVTGSGALNVLHCVATGPDADAAVTRAAVAALISSGNSAVALRTGHTLRWASLWRAGVVVTPRTTPAPDVDLVNHALMAAQYRLLSLRRDVGRTSLASGGRSWVTGDSTVPALLPVVPDFAKAVALDALQQALCSTAVNDPAAPLLAKLAQAVIDVWNVFRVTVDRGWTRVAAASVYSAANLLVQRVEEAGLPSADPTTLAVPLTGVGTVTTSLGYVVQQHGLTTALVRLALAAAAQIAYDLRDVAQAEWVDAYNQLQVPLSGSTPWYSAGSATAPRNDQVLECHPYVFAPPTPAVVPSAFLLAGGQLVARTDADVDPTLRLGSYAVMASAASLAADTNAAIATAYAMLTAEIDAMSPLWLSMAQDPIADAESTGAFLSAVAFGFAGLAVQGVVDTDGTHVQRFALASEAMALLPLDWAGITVTSISYASSSPTVLVVSNSR